MREMKAARRWLARASICNVLNSACSAFLRRATLNIEIMKPPKAAWHRRQCHRAGGDLARAHSRHLLSATASITRRAMASRVRKREKIRPMEVASPHDRVRCDAVVPEARRAASAASAHVENGEAVPASPNGI